MLVNGNKEQKDGWHRDHGHEVGMFIYKLIEKGGIPPTSADRKTGGIVIHGWSAGAGDAMAMVAHADTLPEDVRSRLASHMRALIIQGAYRLCITESRLLISFVAQIRLTFGHVWRNARPNRIFTPD